MAGILSNVCYFFINLRKEEIAGYLFIGHSESLIREETGYKYIMPAMYRKE
ncbi:hypothetical protein CLORY_07730 [Clostridium oryzae]|uniref:Uncharacterized protein n=1 Tax=Clostridium oryzae TaxID=1450648 RepID=A0A1V4IVZ1_9CLOT|nr:hypothetical protein CLORY_07730 [Clostridium oryzae]